MNKSVCSIVLNDFRNDTRVLKEAQSLQAAGYAVTVVALHEEGLEEHEVFEGVTVHRVRLRSRNWSKHTAAQLLKYLEFLIRTLARYRRQDIFHCNDLAALPVGVLARLTRRGVKVVYDAHEHETERNGLHGSRKRLSKIAERLLIRHADGVITVADMIAEDYVRLYGIEKPTLVLNVPRYADVPRRNRFREQLGIGADTTIFLYQGALVPGRGVELLMEAVQTLEHRNVALVVMGFGVLADEVKRVAAASPAVFFKDAVPYGEILEYSSSADFGISYLQDTCLSYRYALPNKLFEYLMAGLPVVGSALPEVERLISTHRVGVIAPVDSPSGIADALERAMTLDTDELAANIAELKRTYNWENQEKRLLELYSRL